MSPDHVLAQDLAIKAGLALREGRHAEARILYTNAADYELRALKAVSPTKARTWGILAVSTISLLYKAKKYPEAEAKLYSFLARDKLAPFARHQLKELLEAVLDEQTLPAGFSYSGEEIMFSLRGRDIGYGTAPFDLVLQKGAELKSIVTRAAELRGGFAFRRSGGPPHTVSDFVQARATQPTAGSYRFAIRLTEPAQAEMFDPPKLRAADVTDTLFSFARLASAGTSEAREELRRLVPSDDYRHAMLRLLRNVLPANGGVSEVELIRTVAGAGQEGPQLDRVRLSSATRYTIAKTLEGDLPQMTERREDLTGVLRALHLDRKWLEISTPDRGRLRLETDEQVLDDVVGPMVNRKVRVRTRPILRQGQERFHVLDIELDED